MGNFQGGRGGGGGFKGGDKGGYKKSSFGNGRGEYRPNPVVVMHKATCAQCGKPCEVPFRPNGEKPIYCRDCFSGKKEDGFTETRAPRREFNNDRNDRSERHERPAYTPSAPSAPAHDSLGEVKRHLVDIGNKLDRLLSAIEKNVPAKAEVVEVKAKGPSLKSIVKKVVSKKKTK